MAYIPGNKIGEYVHARYENYKRYGLARKLSIQSASTQSLSKYVYEARQAAYASLAHQNQKSALLKTQNALNYLMGKSTKAPDGTVAGAKEGVQNALVEILSTKIKALSAEDIDWTTLSLKDSGVQKLKNANVDTNRMLQELQQFLPEGSSTEDVAKRMLKISTLRTDIASNRNSHYIGSFIRRVQNLKAAIASLDLSSGKIAKINQQIDNLLQNAELAGRTSGIFQNATLYSDLVKIADEVLFLQSVAGIEGFLAEGAVASIGAMFAQETGKTVKNLIEKNLVGSTKEKNIYFNSAFMKGLDTGMIMKGSNYRKSSDGITWELRSGVDGKIDAIITIDDSQLKASVKSYNLASQNPHIKGVTLVSGTNLLFLFSNQIRFFNHYLNQTAETAPQNVVIKANEIMKTMIFLSSLTGGGYRRAEGGSIYQNRADVFIINNKNRPGDIKVVSIGELFSHILHTNMQGVNINLADNHTWANKWETNNLIGTQVLDPAMANVRISKLLHQVHAKKIKASIEFTNLQKILNQI